MNETYTIHELAARAAAAIGETEQHSARVSEVPTERTIRYYTQLGILPKPLRFEGRTAIYGERHVQLLVAVKQLQVQGLTLSEVQQKLVGISDSELKTLSDTDPVPTPPRSTQREFWAEAPADPESKETEDIEHGFSGALRLSDSVLLVLEDLQRELQPSDLAAIQIAAGPLLKLLRTRNLVPGTKGRKT